MLAPPKSRNRIQFQISDLSTKMAQISNLKPTDGFEDFFIYFEIILYYFSLSYFFR